MTAMPRRVLVVDDHPAVALALKVAFRADGRYVLGVSAETGAEGLERVCGHDAVLLDLQLPDLCGPQLVAAFRDKAPGVPVILHSSADDTPAVEAVRPLVDAIVVKGDPGEVLAALDRVTRG
jgi:DNA-binding NarL/FixJ family response regulator